jgi:hypothetical protein
MMREGYSREEIYDVLSGAGFLGEHVQLLIDRVAAEFREACMGPRPSRLAAEVEEVFGRKFEELSHATLTSVDSLARQLELLRTEIEKLGRRVVELQSITRARTFSEKEKRFNGKSHKYKVGK